MTAYIDKSATVVQSNRFNYLKAIKVKKNLQCKIKLIVTFTYIARKEEKKPKRRSRDSRSITAESANVVSLFMNGCLSTIVGGRKGSVVREKWIM